MGSIQSIQKINYESMQNIINNTSNKFLLINTLDITNQGCLIKNTILPEREIAQLNYYLRHDKNINIVIYGENCCDSKVIDKYKFLVGTAKDIIKKE